MMKLNYQFNGRFDDLALVIDQIMASILAYPTAGFDEDTQNEVDLLTQKLDFARGIALNIHASQNGWDKLNPIDLYKELIKRDNALDEYNED